MLLFARSPPATPAPSEEKRKTGIYTQIKKRSVPVQAFGLLTGAMEASLTGTVCGTTY